MIIKRVLDNALICLRNILNVDSYNLIINFFNLVVLGGRSPESNIEPNDVKCVIVSKIRDTFYQFDHLKN